jgi:hypothetical protein
MTFWGIDGHGKILASIEIIAFWFEKQWYKIPMNYGLGFNGFWFY